LFSWGLGSNSKDPGLTSPLSLLFPGSTIVFLQKGLPVFAQAKEAVATATDLQAGKIEEKAISEELLHVAEDLPEKPVEVVFYHTHNAETYVSLDGKGKVEGKNGGVSLAAAEMIKVLEEKDGRCVHDLTIHDYPDYDVSYINSEVTAKRLVEEYPDHKAIIDVHRDAGLERKEVVKVGEEASAKLLLIIGTGERLSNPHWRENYAFAQKIAQKMREDYPGVLKEVRLRPGRYNQHLSPRAVLVEVGSEKNTLDEALVAARCFSSALAAVLLEDAEQANSSD
jgi:stage II sporulation protein P